MNCNQTTDQTNRMNTNQGNTDPPELTICHTGELRAALSYIVNFNKIEYKTSCKCGYTGWRGAVCKVCNPSLSSNT